MIARKWREGELPEIPARRELKVNAEAYNLLTPIRFPSLLRIRIIFDSDFTFSDDRPYLFSICRAKIAIL